jgi:hypothetical protein
VGVVMRMKCGSLAMRGDYRASGSSVDISELHPGHLNLILSEAKDLARE